MWLDAPASAFLSEPSIAVAFLSAKKPNAPSNCPLTPIVVRDCSVETSQTSEENAIEVDYDNSHEATGFTATNKPQEGPGGGRFSMFSPDSSAPSASPKVITRRET